MLYAWRGSISSISEAGGRSERSDLGKAVKAPSIHPALEEGRTHCFIQRSIRALNGLHVCMLLLPTVHLSWLPILLTDVIVEIMASQTRAPSCRSTRRGPDRRLWRLRVAVVDAPLSHGGFPLLARQNSGTKELALKFRIILGLPSSVFWLLAGYLRMGIDGVAAAHCSLPQLLIQKLDGVQIFCQIWKNCPCLCLYLRINQTWAPR